MSAIQAPLSNRPHRSVGYVASALGALVAVGVAVLFLTLAGSTHHVRPTTTGLAASPTKPLIQSRSVAMNPETGALHGSVVIASPSAAGTHAAARTYTRQDKSFGTP